MRPTPVKVPGGNANLPVTRKSTPASASTGQPRKRSAAAKPLATTTETTAKAPRRVASKAVAASDKPAQPVASRAEPAASKALRAPKAAAAVTAAPKAAPKAKATKPAKAAPKPGKAAKETKPKPATTRAAAAPKAKPAAARARKSAEKPIDERVREAVVARLDSMKAVDLKQIDVRGKTSVTDCIVIATGTSTRHVKSMADEVVVTAKKLGMMPLGVEGEKEAEWVLVDLGDTVIHVMLPRTREFYALERLWTMAEESRANPA